jgi:hypothetical protein
VSSSFDNPLADEVDLGGNRVKVYEEVPGQLTISFSKSPGMWAGFTIPAEASDLLLETVAAAVTARDADDMDRILIALNAYQGNNIWQDIILGLDGYDEALTDDLDCGRSDRFALADGTVIRLAVDRGEWQVS